MGSEGKTSFLLCEILPLLFEEHQRSQCVLGGRKQGDLTEREVREGMESVSYCRRGSECIGGPWGLVGRRYDLM